MEKYLKYRRKYLIAKNTGGAQQPVSVLDQIKIHIQTKYNIDEGKCTTDYLQLQLLKTLFENKVSITKLSKYPEELRLFSQTPEPTVLAKLEVELMGKDNELKVSAYGFHTDRRKVKRVTIINAIPKINKYMNGLVAHYENDQNYQNDFYKMIHDQITTDLEDIKKLMTTKIQSYLAVSKVEKTDGKLSLVRIKDKKELLTVTVTPPDERGWHVSADYLKKDDPTKPSYVNSTRIMSI